ncbi:MAG: TolC family protein [Nitrospiraceae bacterium]
MKNMVQFGLAVLLMAVVISVVPVHAQTAPPATQELPDLVNEALARNPELQAMRQQWEAASNRITQSRTLPDPTLGVQFWNFPESFNVTHAQNTIISLSQKFPFPGKLDLQGEVAGRAAGITEQALHAKERDLIARVKQTYYDLFFAHKAIQIHLDEIDLLKQFFEIAMAKFRTGKGSQVDVLKAQLEQSTLHQELPVLEQRRDTVQAKLNTLRDRDPHISVSVPPDPVPIRFDGLPEDLYRLALGDRPELKAAKLAIERNERSRAFAERQYYPDLEVAFQRFQNFQAPDGFGAIAIVNLPFAFWTKPKYDASVREAKAAAAAANADYHAWQNLTRFQINELLAKVRAQERVAELYRTTILPQAQQSLESARAGYRTGRADFLDLIEAERALRELQLAYYRAVVERENQLAALEQVTGSKF